MKLYELTAKEDGAIVRIVRRWGRAGAGQLTRLELEVALEDAPRVLERLERKRARRGYVVVEERRTATCDREIRWTASSENAPAPPNVHQLGLFT